MYRETFEKTLTTIEYDSYFAPNKGTMDINIAEI